MQEKISFDNQIGFIDRFIRKDCLQSDLPRVDRIMELQKNQSILFLDEFLGAQSGKELETTRIGYPPLKGVKYDLDLAPNPAPNRHFSRYRLVYGPVDFYLGGKPTEIPLISTCAPNINTSEADINKFYGNQHFEEMLYKTECKKLADFIVSAVKNNGQDRLIMPAYGLGVYIDKLDPQSKIKARKAMYEAFAEAAQQHGINIDWIIWKGDKQAQETASILNGYNLKNIRPIVHSDMLTYAKDCKQQGAKIALLNPGSDRTIGGQYHMPNKKTLEEQIAQQSDLLLLHSELNEPMVKQFKADISNRREKLNQASIVHPSIKSARNESTKSHHKPFIPTSQRDNKTIANQVVHSVLDNTSLIVGDKDTNGNSKVFFHDEKEAQNFVTFLAENDIKGRNGQLKTVQQDGSTYFIILTSSQLETVSKIQMSEKAEKAVISPLIKDIKPNFVLQNSLGAKDANGNSKVFFHDEKEAQNFVTFLAENDIKGRNGQLKTVQQDGSTYFIILTSSQLETVSKMQMSEKVERVVIRPQNEGIKSRFELPNRLDLTSIQSYVKGINSIVGHFDNYKCIFTNKDSAQAFSGFLAENGIKGQRSQPKTVQTNEELPFIMLTSWQGMMINKMGEVTQAIAKGVSKAQKQHILIRILEDNKFSVRELNMLYNIVKDVDGLNTHTNYYTDKFFGIEKTTSWQNTLKEFRLSAMTALFDEVESKNTQEEKLELLAYAKTLPLFHEHRNNSIFSGAWGRTKAVEIIEELEDDVRSDENKMGKPGSL